MLQMNIHETKAHLSRLLEQIEQGEEVIIERHGKPIARLVPYQKKVTQKRQPDRWKDKIEIHDDFDAPLPDDMAINLGLK